MDFDEGGKVAGGVGAALSDPAVRAVMSEFGDGCLARYGVDIREHRTYFGPANMRAVRSFVKEYGQDDAVSIVRTLFGPPYGGYVRGRAVGVEIFTAKGRSLAQRLLLEA